MFLGTCPKVETRNQGFVYLHVRSVRQFCIQLLSDGQDYDETLSDKQKEHKMRLTVPIRPSGMTVSLTRYLMFSSFPAESSTRTLSTGPLTTPMIYLVN